MKLSWFEKKVLEALTIIILVQIYHPGPVSNSHIWAFLGRTNTEWLEEVKAGLKRF